MSILPGERYRESLTLPPQGHYTLVGASKLQRNQQNVAQQYMAERSRQLSRVASASIFGHVRDDGPVGPTLSEFAYSKLSSPDALGLSAGAFGKKAPEIQVEQYRPGASHFLPRPQQNLAPTPQMRSPPQGKNYGGTAAAAPQQLRSPAAGVLRSPAASGHTPVSPQQKPPELDVLLDGIRARFRDKGIISASQIEAEFKRMDTNKDGLVSFEEFCEGVLSRGILRSEAEARAVFSYFDSDDSAGIDYHEFVYLVRGALNDRRKAVVHQAFRLLDRSGDGVITVEDLAEAFDSSNSLEVMSGSKSAEEAMEEFLALFDTVNRDGKVTLAEFERYYEDVGALITSDDYFVMMVQNAWHLEGAHGGHCLRVRVTDSNGFSKVVEVREDVGLDRQSPQFPGQLRRILAEKYGITDVDCFEVQGRY